MLSYFYGKTPTSADVALTLDYVRSGMVRNADVAPELFLKNPSNGSCGPTPYCVQANNQHNFPWNEINGNIFRATTGSLLSASSWMLLAVSYSARVRHHPNSREVATEILRRWSPRWMLRRNISTRMLAEIIPPRDFSKVSTYGPSAVISLPIGAVNTSSSLFSNALEIVPGRRFSEARPIPFGAGKLTCMGSNLATRVLSNIHESLRSGSSRYLYGGSQLSPVYTPRLIRLPSMGKDF
ncbi:hypothetical protein CVAR292_00503 [Corynebacterium variabile]|uniref:Cytochrome P450 n=1 Tax=Corynebacterium variabile TaxID=1727 RepID=A0A0X8XVL6_9CORY|nr:hypothetical protein CVAR292_00503 [Corynebacterium variabile]